MSLHRFCQMGCGKRVSSASARFCSAECRAKDNALRKAEARNRVVHKSVRSTIYHLLAKRHPDIFASLHAAAKKEKP